MVHTYSNQSDFEGAISFLEGILPPIQLSTNHPEGIFSLNTKLPTSRVTHGTTSPEALKLYNFLYNKGVLLMFIINTLKSGIRARPRVIRVPISYAFNWGGTPEGHTYWENLSNEYTNI